jgi:prepilin-type N-terminal cleavage/methylation domain-containing protein
MLQLKKNLQKNINWKSNDGLTMLELLVTIAILGIVTAIASPIIISMIQQAQIDAYKGEMNYVSDSTYKMINGTFGQPSLAAGNPTNNGNPIKLESMGPNSSAAGNGNVNGYWFDVGQMSLPFDATDASALVIWENSRVIRVVPTQERPDTDTIVPVTNEAEQIIEDACITAWVGDRNLVIKSVKSPAVTEDNLAPCGLIPGPIEEPEAPSAPTVTTGAEGGTLSNLVASSITPPSNLGSTSSGIAIEEYRVTCVDSTGGKVTGTSPTNTINFNSDNSNQLTRGETYECTAAISTNAFPGYGPESASSGEIKIPEEPTKPTGLQGEGRDGVVNLNNWTVADYDGCNTIDTATGAATTSNRCDSTQGPDEYRISAYEVQYALGVADTLAADVAESDFTNPRNGVVGIVSTGTATTNYALSNQNISDYSAALPQLVNGETYYIRIRAVSSANVKGAWSDPIVRQTATEPKTIDNARGEDGYDNIALKFDMPDNGGLPISKLTVWYDVTQDYDAKGTDADGNGIPLNEVTLDIDTENIIATSDELPATGTTGVGIICSNGLYVWTGSEWQGSCAEATFRVTGLPDSTSYFLKVKTENEMGESAWSDNGNTVDDVAAATQAPPDAPEDASASIDESGDATVTWQ